MTDDDLAWLGPGDDADQATREVHVELRRSMKQGVPGKPLPNAAYRFNPPGADRSPFRNVGKTGYEAESRELMRLAQKLDEHGSE